MAQVPAEASERSPRSVQKQSRTVATPRPTAATPHSRAQLAARAGVARQANANRRQAAAAPVRERSQSHTVAAAGRAARNTASARAALSEAAPRLETRAPAVSLGLMRPAFAMGAGTPILPVSMSSGLSCVPFARMATGMAISGDARMWWHNAAGEYARGSAPERGAVLSFPSSGGMRRGHVAVVSRVVGARTIHIDHSNWAGPGIRRATVMRGVVVMDVSDRNDWTSVRVQVGHDSSSFGRTYPTHGFIYNRPAGTRMMTARSVGFSEVAEASPHAMQHQRLTAQLLGR